MCRLFAISSPSPKDMTSRTKDLLSYYSNGNEDGFGIAYLNNHKIKSLKNEKAAYKYIFSGKPFPIIKSSAVIGHDRNATSEVCYLNTHPFLNENKSIALVHNGWLGNSKEFRKGLEAEGHKFTSKDVDTEVLLHMYEKYGDEFINKVREKSKYDKLNTIMLTKDGRIIGVSDGALYMTKFDDGSRMLSSTKLFLDSKEVPDGTMVVLKKGKIIQEKKIFKPETYVYSSGYTDYIPSTDRKWNWKTQQWDYPKLKKLGKNKDRQETLSNLSQETGYEWATDKPEKGRRMEPIVGTSITDGIWYALTSKGKPIKNSIGYLEAHPSTRRADVIELEERIYNKYGGGQIFQQFLDRLKAEGFDKEDKIELSEEPPEEQTPNFNEMEWNEDLQMFVPRDVPRERQAGEMYYA